MNQFNHPLYNTFNSMKQRCYNVNTTSYEYYGAKGIKVCERWLIRKQGFLNFVEDMGERPDGYTLDRIDSNKDYEPSNCRWTDINTQNLNRSDYRKRKELTQATQRDTLIGERKSIMPNRKVKNDWIGGRADADLKELVDEYIEAAEITQGQLVRKAVAEYIKNHPVKED